MLSEIVEYTNEYLHIREIEDWPNALNGLQIENSGRATKIGAAVDVSTRVLTAAANKDVDLLIVHHGLFWPGLQSVTGSLRRQLKLAFVRRRRHAILNRPGMNHHADPIKHEHSDPESGGSDRGQDSENDRNRSNDEQNDRPDNPMAFVNVTKSRNHTEQDCHRIARLRFRRRGRFTRPIAVRA